MQRSVWSLFYWIFLEKDIKRRGFVTDQYDTNSDGFGFEVLKGSEISNHQANKSSCNQNPILHNHRLKCTNRRTTTRKPSRSWGLVTAQYETNSDGFGVLEGSEIFDHQANNSSCSQNQILHDHRLKCTKRRTTTRKPSKSRGLVTANKSSCSQNPIMHNHHLKCTRRRTTTRRPSRSWYKISFSGTTF
ncbi:uncharacterized protein LOC114288766 isoform X2 [Camellia sinensis]|uniref:uncharacterized protein LOC114288766 isoform X2 n=1 Tax=Camellia sinensis TaxID=4442 RepID=UPI001036CE09|nr:uncharacterized protein LOC114288766 isoform X2 [Camellia sinensis]